ncbi:MAG: NAD-dependent epimerase/dehydratase family protein [Pseudomonadota bacterium]
MKYLVTGATGFLGPYLIKKLISNGHTCKCLVRQNSDIRFLKNIDAEIVQGDITRSDTLYGIAEDIDVLIHMATLGHMSNFAVTQEMFETINVQGTRNIMQEALRSGVKKIVHCSTVAAMGICPDNPATEESECRPHHSYGRSKLQAEQAVLQMVAESGLPAAIVRFSMVYGPGDPRDILKLTRLAKKNLFPKIGNRLKLTPLIHAEDAIQGILLAAEKGRTGEIYLITNPESIPFDRIRTIIEKGLGISRIPIYIPEWIALALAAGCEIFFSRIGKTPPVSRKNIESTLADRVFSITKAQRELGFQPSIDPAKGLRETVIWYKHNGWV